MEIELVCQERKLKFQSGTKVGDIVKEFFAKEDSIIGIKSGKEIFDLLTPIDENINFEPIYIGSKSALPILWHSTSHVMAQAVKKLYPGTKLGIGPAIESGFYYDFDIEESISDDDLLEIEKVMGEIVSSDFKFSRKVITKDEAYKLFEEMGEIYKLELLEEIEDPFVSIYQQGDFIDLCKGPHLPSTGYIRAFKLTSLAGAYWRGDENRKMLKRIYGVSFFSKKDLEKHLKNIEEAKKRDHRILGRELDLFSIEEEAGPGLVIYHPNGAMLRSILEDFEKREHIKRGYKFVKGPHLLKAKLWEKSGHLDNYREYMYFCEIEGEKYGIKPMNCLSHILVYRSKMRSYRDLPIRYFELGTVHRHERSGVLHGLMRVREFTQDDAHIFCRKDQVKDEVKGVLNFVDDVMKIFGFSYEIELSTRPKKYIGTEEQWEMATKALEESLLELGKEYEIEEGEGAFYGPKIDIKLRDSLGRKWQCATIQCDFALPERFDLYYVDRDGDRKRPVMIHRVILGAIERFMGVIIEHYGGAFPVWLAPIQAIILTITDRAKEFGEVVYNELFENGIRVEKDFRNEKLGYKVREAQLRKIPYALVIGDKEVERKFVTPRERGGKQLGSMSVSQFISFVKEREKNYL